MGEYSQRRWEHKCLSFGSESLTELTGLIRARKIESSYLPGLVGASHMNIQRFPLNGTSSRFSRTSSSLLETRILTIPVLTLLFCLTASADETVYQDELENLNCVYSSTMSALLFATTSQPWAEEDVTRLYRDSAYSEAFITYNTPQDIVDLHVKAFIYAASGKPAPVGRLLWSSSTDGTEWSEAKEFRVIDYVVPDPESPAWYRYHLGVHAGAIPAGTRYIRIKLYGAAGNTQTQLGNVKIVTAP